MKMSKNNINELNKSIKNLENKNFFTIYESYWKMFYISLIKGLASGLGWVIGATLLVSILTFILSQIEFIPIIGQWVSMLILEIEGFNKTSL